MDLFYSVRLSRISMNAGFKHEDLLNVFKHFLSKLYRLCQDLYLTSCRRQDAKQRMWNAQGVTVIQQRGMSRTKFDCFAEALGSFVE